MIYIYKGKKVNADSHGEACTLLGVTMQELKKNGRVIRYAQQEENAPLSQGKGYEERLSAWGNKEKDTNISMKDLVSQLKDNPCCICGYDGVSRAKVFHHVEPSTKSFEIRVGRVRVKYLQEEIGKCLLLCLNCHAEIHEIMENGKPEDMKKLYKRHGYEES
jgi:hypothetical protein